MRKGDSWCKMISALLRLFGVIRWLEFLAVGQGHVAALQFLLDEGTPHGPDVSGRTLMHEVPWLLHQAPVGFP